MWITVNFLLIVSIYLNTAPLYFPHFNFSEVRKFSMFYFIGIRFVDSGVDCADASSASVVCREARFAAKESSCFKKTRNEAECNVSHPSTHHRQRSSESPATVSIIPLCTVVWWEWKVEVWHIRNFIKLTFCYWWKF